MKPFFAAVIGLAPLVAWAGDTPEQILTSHGLKNSGGVWYGQGDLEIPDRVQAIERLERRLHDLRKQRDWLLEQNESMKVQLVTLTAAQRPLREARDAAKSGSAQRKRLDEEIKRQTAAIDQLKKSIVSPDKLGGTMPLKGVVMDLVAVRSELAFHLLGVRRQIEELSSAYENLRKNAAVTAALAALQPPGQLAPNRAHANELRTLGRIEKLIFTDELPVYREKKQLRLAAIANEELPITFSLYETGEPTVITHTMAESLGLAFDEAARRSLRLDGKHEVKVSSAKLATLRFGQRVFKDLEVAVLPPEHENLGARIAISSLSGVRARFIPEQLRLRLELADTQ